MKINKFRNLIIPLVIVSLLFFAYYEVTRTRHINSSIIEINRGDRLITIAEKMGYQSRGFKIPFIGYLVITGNTKNIQAGTYQFNSEMSIVEVVDKMINGRVVVNSATIVEGWTIREIAEHLEKKEFVSKEDFINLVGISGPQGNLMGVEKKEAVDAFNSKILRDLPEGSSLEGYLFPDTYRIDSDSPENFVRRMIGNLESKLQDFWEEIEESEMSIHEIITMASLIEREVPNLHDKKMVADILFRRMEVGMPLQVDATVNYVTGRRGIDVTITETRVDSPYNTYRYRGLPPGPISNPGLDSIKATINPTPNDYWYYLSDPSTGKTVFSRNHIEHVEAKNKYLR